MQVVRGNKPVKSYYSSSKIIFTAQIGLLDFIKLLCRAFIIDGASGNLAVWQNQFRLGKRVVLLRDACRARKCKNAKQQGQKEHTFFCFAFNSDM